MYCCQYCGKEYPDNGNKTKHEKYFCKSNKNRIVLDKINYHCQYCNKEVSSRSSLGRHEVSCINNPDRKKHIPWNKGLTKETSEIIRKNAENFSNRIKMNGPIGFAGLKGELNYSKRPEVKEKVSKKMLGNHNNNPSKTGRGKKGWYQGIFCSSTYELAYLIYCLDHNIDIRRCDKVYDYEYRGKHYKYYPDFIVEGTIIEIKGFWTEQVDAKTASVTDMPIKVLYRKDLKQVFDYINSTYNKQVDINIHELFEDMGS